MSAARWVRESRWALVALAVLVPAAVLTAVSSRLLPYLEATEVRPTTARSHETVRYAGTDLTLTSLGVVDGAEAGAPEGRDVVVATWQVEVLEPSETANCATYAFDTVDGIERRWPAQSYLSIDLEFDDRYEEYCTLAEAGSYDLLQTYLVPAGAVVEPVVELSSASESPVVLRFTE